MCRRAYARQLDHLRVTDFRWHIPTLHTERLVLRAPKLTDSSALEAFYASDHSRFVGGPADARASNRTMMAVFGNWALHGFGLWYIADRVTDALLGWTGLFFSPGWEAPELGWTLMPEAQGKSIAFEAATTARDYAARHLGQDGVISYIAPENARSLTLAKRLGAAFERTTELLGKPVQVFRHPMITAAQGAPS